MSPGVVMSAWPYHCPDMTYTASEEAAKAKRRREQWRKRQNIRPSVGRMIRLAEYSGYNRQQRRDKDFVRKFGGQ